MVSPSQIGPACDENVAAAVELAAWVAGAAPPSGSDDATADTGTDEGHDPPPDHDTGSAGDDEAGTSAALDEGDDEANDDGGDDDGTQSGANPLPPGYGLGGDPIGSECTIAIAAAGSRSPCPCCYDYAVATVRRSVSRSCRPRTRS